MPKFRWMVLLPLLLAHGVSESAQPGASEVSPAASSPAVRTRPQPGSEAAVRRLFAEVAAGKFNESLMTPALAAEARPQLPRWQQDLLALGKVESVTFLSVSPEDGADLYSVTLTNGLLRFRIRLDARGRVEVASVYMG